MSDERIHRIHLTLDSRYRFTATFPEVAVPTVTLDEPPPLGEAHGPNAASLLGAAVGNCLAASLLFCMTRARVDVQTLDAEVSVHLGRNDAGRYRITGIDVGLEPQIDPADRAKLSRCEQVFEDFCIVTASVRQGIPVSVHVKDEVPSAVEAGV